MLFSNFWAAVSAFALLSCSTVHVAALFLYWFIEQINDDDDADDDDDDDDDMCGVRNHCSKPSKAIDFGINPKRIHANFLLVIKSNLNWCYLASFQIQGDLKVENPQYSQTRCHLTPSLGVNLFAMNLIWRNIDKYTKIFNSINISY